MGSLSANKLNTYGPCGSHPEATLTHQQNWVRREARQDKTAVRGLKVGTKPTPALLKNLDHTL